MVFNGETCLVCGYFILPHEKSWKVKQDIHTCSKECHDEWADMTHDERLRLERAS